MQREVRIYLHDIQQACALIAQFTEGKRFADYQADALLRSGVERQFEIIGEAMGMMLKLAPELSDCITDAPHIIAFRNILIHGYARVSNETVWGVVETHLEQLSREINGLLAT